MKMTLGLQFLVLVTSSPFTRLYQAALETLGRVAAENGKPMLLGRLVVDEVYGVTRGRLADLLSKDLRRTTGKVKVAHNTTNPCHKL